MAERESAKISRFCDAISYGLVQLRAPEFALKIEQKKAILAVYEGKGRLCEPTNWFVEEHLLSDPPPLCLITSQWCRKMIYNRGALIQINISWQVG